MPLRVPISMFCGLPVSVATDPALDEKASPSKYGSAGRAAASTRATTSGVHITQTVSFTSSAESVPATSTSTARSARGPCARRSATQAIQRKIPARAITLVITIMPSSRTSVSHEIASR